MKTWMKLVLIFGLLGAGIAWMLIDAGKREARMTAKAEAVLTDVQLHRDAESSSLDETRLRFRFPVAGRTVEAEDSLPGDRTGELSPTERVTICYNPADPAEADLQLDPNAACGG